MTQAPIKSTLLDWARPLIKEDIINVEDIAATDYSYVLKINTAQTSYYLKKTPPKLYVEANVINILNKECGFKHVPEILAQDDDLHCFFMPACGDLTLRTLFGETLQHNLLDQGIETYTNLQRASADHIQKFLNCGIPDWRVENLPDVYSTLMHDEKRITAWGLTDPEQERLQRSQKLFIKLCDNLDSLNLPAVLNHSDFHPNAMLLDQSSGDINIIDIGEVTIGNPLLPLASCLTNYLDHRWKIRADANAYESIKSATLNHWHLSGDKVMDLVEILGPLNYTLAYRELMELSDYESPKWKTWIKLAFFDYLDQLEQRYL